MDLSGSGAIGEGLLALEESEQSDLHWIDVYLSTGKRLKIGAGIIGTARRDLTDYSVRNYE
jgi:hypothetical protein